MAPRDDDSGLGHEHTDNVELEDHVNEQLDDDGELFQPEAIPNTSVAEAARRRRGQDKTEELEPEDLSLREYTDAVPPPPPPPQIGAGAGPGRHHREMTTADEPEGGGGDDRDPRATAGDADTDAIKGEEWTSTNGPPAPPESSRVTTHNSWLARGE